MRKRKTVTLPDHVNLGIVGYSNRLGVTQSDYISTALFVANMIATARFVDEINNRDIDTTPDAELAQRYRVAYRFINHIPFKFTNHS